MNSTKTVLIPVLLFIIILSCSRKKTNNTEKVISKENAVESPVSISAYMDAAFNGNSDKVKKFIALEVDIEVPGVWAFGHWSGDDHLGDLSGYDD